MSCRATSCYDISLIYTLSHTHMHTIQMLIRYHVPIIRPDHNMISFVLRDTISMIDLDHRPCSHTHDRRSLWHDDIQSQMVPLSPVSIKIRTPMQRRTQQLAQYQSIRYTTLLTTYMTRTSQRLLWDIGPYLPRIHITITIYKSNLHHVQNIPKIDPITRVLLIVMLTHDITIVRKCKKRDFHSCSGKW